MAWSRLDYGVLLLTTAVPFWYGLSAAQPLTPLGIPWPKILMNPEHFGAEGWRRRYVGLLVSWTALVTACSVLVPHLFTAGVHDAWNRHLDEVTKLNVARSSPFWFFAAILICKAVRRSHDELLATSARSIIGRDGKAKRPENLWERLVFAVRYRKTLRDFLVVVLVAFYQGLFTRGGCFLAGSNKLLLAEFDSARLSHAAKAIAGAGQLDQLKARLASAAKTQRSGEICMILLRVLKNYAAVRDLLYANGERRKEARDTYYHKAPAMIGPNAVSIEEWCRHGRWLKMISDAPYAKGSALKVTLNDGIVVGAYVAHYRHEPKRSAHVHGLEIGEPDDQARLRKSLPPPRA